MDPTDLLIALASAMLGYGGNSAVSYVRRGSADEKAIRREAKMEAAVERLFEGSKELLAEIQLLRQRSHEQGNKLHDHEMRISHLEDKVTVRKFAESPAG